MLIQYRVFCFALQALWATGLGLSAISWWTCGAAAKCRPLPANKDRVRRESVSWLCEKILFVLFPGSLSSCCFDFNRLLRKRFRKRFRSRFGAFCFLFFELLGTATSVILGGRFYSVLASAFIFDNKKTNKPKMALKAFYKIWSEYAEVILSYYRLRYNRNQV